MAKRKKDMTRLELLRLIWEEAERLGSWLSLSREMGVNHGLLYGLKYQYQELTQPGYVNTQARRLRPDVCNLLRIAHYFGLSLDQVMRAFDYSDAPRLSGE